MATKRHATKAIRAGFPEYLLVSLTEELRGEDGRKSWSFGVSDGVDDESDHEFTGYVHADGTLEGLY